MQGYSYFNQPEKERKSEESKIIGGRRLRYAKKLLIDSIACLCETHAFTDDILVPIGPALAF